MSAHLPALPAVWRPHNSHSSRSTTAPSSRPRQSLGARTMASSHHHTAIHVHHYPKPPQSITHRTWQAGQPAAPRKDYCMTDMHLSCRYFIVGTSTVDPCACSQTAALTHLSLSSPCSPFSSLAYTHSACSSMPRLVLSSPDSGVPAAAPP
jgi:hypothetical protein